MNNLPLTIEKDAFYDSKTTCFTLEHTGNVVLEMILIERSKDTNYFSKFQ